MQKLKNIFKKRFVIKMLALLLLFGVGTNFFQSNIIAPQVVHAATSETQTNKTAIGTQETDNKLIAKTQTLDAILKILYILLWPLLALAGLTLNNGMIYGSFFALDAPLWKFWNIMKNFANFTLGFLVLFEIIKSIFAGFNKDKAISGPMGVIKKALIAGILIQMSWFLLAAVIDISTVATYAIGGLPLSVLEKNDDLGNKPILGNHTKLNLKDYESVNKTAENFDIWYSYGKAKKISKCEVKGGNYIIGLVNGSRSNEINTKDSTFDYKYKDLELCTHGSILYAFDEHDRLRDAKTAPEYSSMLLSLWNDDRDSFSKTTEPIKCPSDTSIASLYKKQTSGLIPKNGINLENCSSRLLAKQLADERMKDQRDNNGGMTMSRMLTDLEGFTGPLVTMYSSLMNFAEISNVPKQGENAGAMWLELLIKTIFALALIVPLMLLCVVLLARIGVLRMVIAFMPFLILIWTFDWKLGDGGDGGGKLMELVGSPGKLAGIIFAPVIIVFALSISVIFMTALSNMLNDDAKQHDFFNSVGMFYDEETQGLNLPGGAETLLNGNDTGSDFDNIKSFSSRLFMNMFGIALVWMLLFAAIKATSLGGQINEKMGGADKLLGKALGAIPIMSVRGSDGQRHGVGLSALGSVVPSALDEKLTRMTSAETSALRQAINPTGGTSKVTETQFRQAIQGIQSGTYKNLDDAFKSMNINSTANAAITQNRSTYNGVAEQLNHKIAANQISSYSRSNIEQMMNSGRIDTSGGTEVQANDGKSYHVTQTKGRFGKDEFKLTEVVDNKEDMQASLDRLHKDLREQQEKAIQADKKLNEVEKQREIAQISIKSKSYHNGPKTNTGTSTEGTDTGETTTE